MAKSASDLLQVKDLSKLELHEIANKGDLVIIQYEHESERVRVAGWLKEFGEEELILVGSDLNKYTPRDTHQVRVPYDFNAPRDGVISDWRFVFSPFYRRRNLSWIVQAEDLIHEVVNLDDLVIVNWSQEGHAIRSVGWMKSKSPESLTLIGYDPKQKEVTDSGQTLVPCVDLDRYLIFPPWAYRGGLED